MRAKFYIKRAVAGAVAVAALLLAGAAQAALRDRDLNGDTVVDAFYDTDLKIIWLRDANVNGGMDWDTAVSWADNYSLGAYSDWRLPTSDTCLGYTCTGSEMGHLWYVELGNTAGGPMTHTGNFQNLESYFYWSGTEYEPNPRFVARGFHTGIGGQNANSKGLVSYAMAVHSVPEPQIYVLLMLGLTGLAVKMGRRRR